MATSEAVLGLHVGLNSSAAVVDASTGEVVYAEQEERFSGTKNHCGFPKRALRAAARHATSTGMSIERVGVGGVRVFPHEMSRADLAAGYRSVYESMITGNEPPDSDTRAGQRMIRDLAAEVLGRNCPVEFYDHHTCHAAAAYYFLRTDQDPMLVITLDGEGDGLAGSVWAAQAGCLERISSTPRRASAGLLYFWVTYLLGFTPHEDEHKIMGIAGHIPPAPAVELGQRLFGDLLDVDEDTLTLHIPLDTSAAPWMRTLTRRCERQRFDRLAGAVQAHVEQLGVRLVQAAVAKTGIDRVLLSGGVFMNVKLNQAVRRCPDVALIDVMPSAGDESLAMGAAYLACQDLNGDVPIPPAQNVYLGTPLRHDDIERALSHSRDRGGRIIASGPGALDLTTDVLRCGHPVGLCTGRAEFGARALGHRSLLAMPGDLAAVDRLNATIKQRDFWMPFAPAILDRHGPALLTDYDGTPSRHMMHAYDTRPDERLRGAVHPGDWTCRPQMLPNGSDEPLAELLRRLETAGELPVLINTSLNTHGNPIARTATNAVGLLCDTPLRYLLLDDRLLQLPG